MPPHSTYVIVLLREIHRLIFTGGHSTLRHNLYFDYKYTIRSFTLFLINVDIYGLTSLPNEKGLYVAGPLLLKSTKQISMT